ncbi:DUF2892 domain-containing protein [Mycobacterium heckeshornense]|uniref:Inner membrane protein YgaP-like transmembrane domain-containing protein n=2 Tax=Mycobacterium heckeshornense TaxID=110505 RepID=A0A7R7GSZ2_9MYCO|nr:DUF2892 domain-containing protein [Mycobacterium heckeshornense]BCO35382.1 hypothetical protein MHEC_18150 [Mycobacterium heckeshornense]
MACTERAALGMPHPHGWPLERVVNLLAGLMVVVSLALGRKHSARWRILTGVVGANLMFNAMIGWCPGSLLLHRLGVPGVFPVNESALF